MTNKSRKQSSLLLTQARKAMAEARVSDDPRGTAIAAVNLGFALFQVNKFSEGRKSFKEVDRIFNELDDFELQVHCKGIETMAYQAAEQFPQAFQAAQSVEQWAVARQDEKVQCDALATQGQILIDSGEEVIANQKLNEALELATKIGDKRRQMNVIGAMGNYCMTIASVEKAESHYEKARDLARELGDREAEIGFHGNLGMLLSFKGEQEQAQAIFEDVLTYVRQTGNQEAEIQALRHLIQVNTKRQNDSQIVAWAEQGVTAAKEISNEYYGFFSEYLIAALYRLERFDEAEQAMKDAVKMARSANNHQKEVDLLLNLGESYLQRNALQEALEAYQQSLPGIQRLQRMVDRGYVLGRMGLILAELGFTDESLQYHEQALELARQHEVLDLEGEQLAMLAMAYLEKGEFDRARLLGETAVATYTKANLTESAENARKLLDKIEAKI